MSDTQSNTPPLSQSDIDGFCNSAGEGSCYGVQKFLEKDGGRACINQRGSAGGTALERAIWNCRAEMVALLLENGADPEVRDMQGKTALIWAAMKYNTAVLTILLEHGANINATDRRGKTAADWAKYAGDEAGLALLHHWPRLQKERQDAEAVRKAQEVLRQKEEERCAAAALSAERRQQLKRHRPAFNPFFKK